MSNLRLQKRLAASILKCGRRKVWIDPNEKSEIQLATTRTAVRKLIHDGYVIKKPRKVHSRFRARQRAMEKKKGRHLGMGSRKGTRNARNPVKLLWIKRQRAMRRLLKRYKESGKIDRRMYHRLYLKAKGNAFKSRTNLIETIDRQLQAKKRRGKLEEEYEARRQAALRRKQERVQARKRALSEQAKIAEEAERLVERRRELEARLRREQEQRKNQPKKKKKAQAQKPSGDGSGGKRKRKRRGGGGGGQQGQQGQQAQAQPQQQGGQQQGSGGKRKRKRRGGNRQN